MLTGTDRGSERIVAFVNPPRRARYLGSIVGRFALRTLADNLTAIRQRRWIRHAALSH